MTEDQLHRQVVDFLRLALPDNAVFHHCANESRGTAAWYKKRASLGTQPGWPDLEILYAGRMIFIELKAPRGRVTKAQKGCHNRLLRAGAVVHVCRSLDEVILSLESFHLMPLKARAA